MDENESTAFPKRIEDFVRKNPLFVGLILIGTIFLLVGAFQYISLKNRSDDIIFTPATSKQEVAGEVLQKEISIDIEGAVENPGVYKLKEGSMVQNALIASGGLSSSADREYIAKHFNLAQKLTDGVKIYIPQKGEQATAVVSVPQNLSSNEVSSPTFGDDAGLININSATLEKLDTLPKVGPVTAQKIVSGRPYNKIEELVSKKILGQKTFDGLKDKIVAN